MAGLSDTVYPANNGDQTTNCNPGSKAVRAEPPECVREAGRLVFLRDSDKLSRNLGSNPFLNLKESDLEQDTPFL